MIKMFVKGLLKRANFFVEFIKFRKLERKQPQKRFILVRKDLFPNLYDNTNTTIFDRHYIYHPAWASRILAKTRPGKHIDISSTLHFCSIISAFIEIEFYDYRPVSLGLTNLSCKYADLSSLFFEDNSIKSLSCMHTIEHIGLGRYGDSLDYNGDLKAMNELSRVLAIGGNLLLVVPIGRIDRIYFNAHRVYSKKAILTSFADLKLIEFTLIPEDASDGSLINDPTDELLSRQNYGCGCFWFQK